MIKTFTLHTIDHELFSAERGCIVWHLTDENNCLRKVTAVTELSRQGFVKTVLPKNDRELPLVELLSYYIEGESFRIDFSRFNESFGYKPREVFPDRIGATPVSNHMKANLLDLFRDSHKESSEL